MLRGRVMEKPKPPLLDANLILMSLKHLRTVCHAEQQQGNASYSFRRNQLEVGHSPCTGRRCVASSVLSGYSMPQEGLHILHLIPMQRPRPRQLRIDTADLTSNRQSAGSVHCGHRQRCQCTLARTRFPQHHMTADAPVLRHSTYAHCLCHCML